MYTPDKGLFGKLPVSLPIRNTDVASKPVFSLVRGQQWNPGDPNSNRGASCSPWPQAHSLATLQRVGVCPQPLDICHLDAHIWANPSGLLPTNAVGKISILTPWLPCPRNPAEFWFFYTEKPSYSSWYICQNLPFQNCEANGAVEWSCFDVTITPRNVPDNITTAVTIWVTIVLIQSTSSLLFSFERGSAERSVNALSHLQKAGIIWWEKTVGALHLVIWKGQFPEELQHYPP